MPPSTTSRFTLAVVARTRSASSTATSSSPPGPPTCGETTTDQVVGDGQLVDELHLRFTHDRPMEWFLPGVPPTHAVVDINFVVVVQFRGTKLACERSYWDDATVLRQVGLLGK